MSTGISTGTGTGEAAGLVMVRGAAARTRSGSERYPAPPDPGYLPPDTSNPSALRLYCFHHAGGAASAFAQWSRRLGPQVCVLPVQLPGREGRAGTPRITDLARLVEEIDDCLGPEPAAPFAFYGHSMGALLAYSLCRRRLHEGRSLPEALLVGAFGPPDQAPDLGPVIGLTDEELAHWLLGLGGMSPSLLHYPTWLAAAVALTRDDLKACHAYRHRHVDGPAPALLPCPIHVFRGSQDPISAGNEEGWSRHTSAECTTHEVQGGHLFAYAAEFGRDPGHPLRRVLAGVGAPRSLVAAARV